LDSDGVVVLLIGEVATLATDYAVALLALVLAWRLRTVPTTRAMAVPFVWLAVAALAGGTFHGLRATLGDAGKTLLWGTTSIAMLGFSFSLLVSYAMPLLPQRRHRGLRTLAAAKLCVCVALLVRDPGFLWLLVDYGGSMLVLVVVYARYAPRTRATVWLCAAVALSLLGALIQRLRLAPATSFNHNDLYHVVQMASMLCFYRAARYAAARAAP
jgi:hypothetical protein